MSSSDKFKLTENKCIERGFERLQETDFIVLYDVEKLSERQNVKRAFSKSFDCFVNMKTLFIFDGKIAESEFNDIVEELESLKTKKMNETIDRLLNSYFTFEDKTKEIKSLIIVTEAELCTLEELVAKIIQNHKIAHVSDFEEELKRSLGLLYLMVAELEFPQYNKLEIKQVCLNLNGAELFLQTKFKKSQSQNSESTFDLTQVIKNTWKNCVTLISSNELVKELDKLVESMDEAETLNQRVIELLERPEYNNFFDYYDKKGKIKDLYYKELFEIVRDQIFRCNIPPFGYDKIFKTKMDKNQKKIVQETNQLLFIDAFKFSQLGQHHESLNSIQQALEIEEALPDYHDSGLILQTMLKMAEENSRCAFYEKADKIFADIEGKFKAFGNKPLLFRTYLSWADHEKRKGNQRKAQTLLQKVVDQKPCSYEEKQLKDLAGFLILYENNEKIEKAIPVMRRYLSDLGQPESSLTLRCNYELQKITSFSSQQVNLLSNIKETLPLKHISFYLTEQHHDYISSLLLISNQEELEGLYHQSVKTLEKALDLCKILYMEMASEQYNLILLQINRKCRMIGNFSKMEERLKKIEQSIKHLSSQAQSHQHAIEKLNPQEIMLQLEYCYYWLLRGNYKGAKLYASSAILLINGVTESESIINLQSGVMFARYLTLMSLCEWQKAKGILGQIIQIQEQYLERCPNLVTSILSLSISLLGSAQFKARMKEFHELPSLYASNIVPLRQSNFELDRHNQMFLNLRFEKALWKALEGLNNSAFRSLTEILVAENGLYENKLHPTILNTKLSKAVCLTRLRNFNEADRLYLELLQSYDSFYSSFEKKNHLKYVEIYIAKAQNNLLAGDFIEAFKDADKALKHLSQTSLLENHYLKVLCNYTFGQIYYQIGELYMSRTYFERAKDMEATLLLPEASTALTLLQINRIDTILFSE